MVLLGLDIGEKRIGVAATDPLGKTAQPLQTITRDGQALSRLAELAAERGVERVVVGLPLLMDGSEGSQARDVRGYAGEISAALGLPVAFVDERLTTREAESVLRNAGAGRAGRREASDRLAASLILRAYMDGRPEE